MRIYASVRSMGASPVTPADRGPSARAEVSRMPPTNGRSPRARGIPSVLVVSDDVIIRRGLEASLTDAGVAAQAATVSELGPPLVVLQDYVLVWLGSRRGIDPYGVIPAIGALGVSVLADVPVVGVHGGPVSAVVRLRMAEAGFRYLLPLSWLADSIDSAAEMLATASIPLTFHLETPLALRQQLGLSLSGSLEGLLAAALAVPAVVWTGYLPQSHLPITRSEVRRLRRIALRLAGLPLPRFSTYATSAFRAPPDAPEWSRVRELVRRSFDLE